MEALCSTEYITDLSGGWSKQPNQRVVRPPALYFVDPVFKLLWANPELSLFFLDTSSHVPKYYFKFCYDRFLSYPCQIFTHKSYHHLLGAELPRCCLIPGTDRKFLLCKTSKTSAGLCQPVVLWVVRGASEGEKWPWREADRSPAFSVEFKNEWNYIYTSPWTFKACRGII